MGWEHSFIQNGDLIDAHVCNNDAIHMLISSDLM